MELFANPYAVEFLTRRGAAGCGLKILHRVVQIYKASWSLMKVALISALDSEAMILLMILEAVKMVTLRVVSVRGGKRGFGERSLRK